MDKETSSWFEELCKIAREHSDSLTENNCRRRQDDALIMIIIATVFTVMGIVVCTAEPVSLPIGIPMLVLGIVLYGKIASELIAVRRELKELRQKQVWDSLKGTH